MTRSRSSPRDRSILATECRRVRAANTFSRSVPATSETRCRARRLIALPRCWSMNSTTTAVDTSVTSACGRAPPPRKGRRRLKDLVDPPKLAPICPSDAVEPSCPRSGVLLPGPPAPDRCADGPGSARLAGGEELDLGEVGEAAVVVADPEHGLRGRAASGKTDDWLPSVMPVTVVRVVQVVPPSDEPWTRVPLARPGTVLRGRTRTALKVTHLTSGSRSASDNPGLTFNERTMPVL